MEDKNAPCLNSPLVLFLSCLGVGFIPKAPGTFGSLVCLPLFYFVGQFQPPFIFLIPILLIGTLFSCYLIDLYQAKNKDYDPSWVVVDEVLGMLTGWLFFTNNDLTSLLLLFVFFRFFDILKPWPISYFDKLKTGFGVVFDDILSGLFAGVLTLLVKIYF